MDSNQFMNEMKKNSKSTKKKAMKFLKKSFNKMFGSSEPEKSGQRSGNPGPQQGKSKNNSLTKTNWLRLHRENEQDSLNENYDLIDKRRYGRSYIYFYRIN